MKIIKTASGKRTIKMSKTEWEIMGKKAGWFKESYVPSQQQRVLLFFGHIKNNISQAEKNLSGMVEDERDRAELLRAIETLKNLASKLEKGLLETPGIKGMI